MENQNWIFLFRYWNHDFDFMQKKNFIRMFESIGITILAYFVQYFHFQNVATALTIQYIILAIVSSLQHQQICKFRNFTNLLIIKRKKSINQRMLKFSLTKTYFLKLTNNLIYSFSYILTDFLTDLYYIQKIYVNS